MSFRLKRRNGNLYDDKSIVSVFILIDNPGFLKIHFISNGP